jgi:EEF1A N-terminal glycine/lysine methyltransferase
MADLIGSGNFSVLGESVLELGAGAGLPGILSILEGANSVVLSDYNSPELLKNLERNVEENIPSILKHAIKVEGHTWGGTGSSILQ